MKTQKEIEAIANDFVSLAFNKQDLYDGFMNGYTQCSLDMADKIKEAYEQGLKDGYACMPSINSLNKQD